MLNVCEFSYKHKSLAIHWYPVFIKLRENLSIIENDKVENTLHKHVVMHIYTVKEVGLYNDISYFLWNAGSTAFLRSAHSWWSVLVTKPEPKNLK